MWSERPHGAYKKSDAGMSREINKNTASTGPNTAFFVSYPHLQQRSFT